jgi:hypothetical protein
MNFLFFVIFITTSAFAAEVRTDCPAINEGRTKEVKAIKKVKIRPTAVAQ